VFPIEYKGLKKSVACLDGKGAHGVYAVTKIRYIKFLNNENTICK